MNPMLIEAVYGETCPGNVFSITPWGETPPWAYAPEWLISEALKHDVGLRKPGRLTVLLADAPGPHTVHKAAAVEPDDWWEVLRVALYMAKPKPSKSVQLLPFAPATSALAALGQKEACIHAESLTADYLHSLIHALSSSGTERLVLVNPPQFSLWQKLRTSGVTGYSFARHLALPRALQLGALSRSRYNLRENEALGADVPLFKSPVIFREQSLVKYAFGDESELAVALLSELEASGGVMSHRAFMDTASSLGPSSRGIARRLLLYGYVVFRQAQVELTLKGIFALSEVK
ncbi:hypothetical protein [Infirmifilum sp. NZ]|uniref:hypothetical protein n=1 Tax=Infirmifilum sp. NZ TaxID=2926850 RepID=UPI0027A6DC00|nr:hypothetical protein [Infirmifilum sp. NZ]UNQ72861.1 hypothetical protein MOV14_07035 [Infirmifilum sp. NZ]